MCLRCSSTVSKSPSYTGWSYPPLVDPFTIDGELVGFVAVVVMSNAGLVAIVAGCEVLVPADDN
jgi:hypothetical protein